MVKVVVVGNDIGYGATKGFYLNSSGGRSDFMFRSTVGLAEEDGTFPSLGGNGGNPDDGYVTIDGRRYVVGDLAHSNATRIIDERAKSWIQSLGFRVLLNRTLDIVLGKTLWDPSIPVSLVTGLPVSYYKSDQSKLSELVRRELIERGVNPNLCEINVVPQPYGTIMEMAFTESLQPIDLDVMRGKVGVIDIGYYTTDFITVENFKPVIGAMESYEAGVSTVLKAIVEDVMSKYEMKISMHKADECVRKGTIRVMGKEQDITDMCNRRLSELVDEIKAHARTIWDNARDLERIYLAGGGSALLGTRIVDIYPQAILATRAHTTNSGGYYKMALANAARKGW